MQEDPTDPGVNADPFSEHVPETRSHVNDPVPVPPEAANDSVWPYVASVVVIVRADCDARLTVMTKVFDDTAS